MRYELRTFNDEVQTYNSLYYLEYNLPWSCGKLIVLVLVGIWGWAWGFMMHFQSRCSCGLFQGWRPRMTSGLIGTTPCKALEEYNTISLQKDMEPWKVLYSASIDKTRLKKFRPRPRGKSVIGKILFEYMIKVAKVSNLTKGKISRSKT